MSTVVIRSDGRKPDELRPVTIARAYTRHAPGSVLVSFGETRVLCTAMFEEKVPPFLRGTGTGWITAEYAMLPSATPTRTPRESLRQGRAQEISRLIGRSLRAVTDLSRIGECQITIDCDVLQADGGTRTAAITGAYVALYDALRVSVQQGNLDSIPLLTGCTAVSVGIVDGIPRVDLNYEEDVRAEVDMNVVMDHEGNYIEVQATAERARFSRTHFDTMLRLAAQAMEYLRRVQREALGLG